MGVLCFLFCVLCFVFCVLCFVFCVFCFVVCVLCLVFCVLCLLSALGVYLVHDDGVLGVIGGWWVFGWSLVCIGGVFGPR